MKAAVVTGAAKPDSIGHEVALRLQKQGIKVAVLDLYEQGFATLPGCLCIKTDVMDVLMKMPHDRRVLPGHSDITSIGREWMLNPFVRVWRGDEPEGTERVRAGGRDATLIVWSPDYDGKGKAWVRYEDGEDAIVAGSSVER